MAFANDTALRMGRLIARAASCNAHAYLEHRHSLFLAVLYSRNIHILHVIQPAIDTALIIR